MPNRTSFPKIIAQLSPLPKTMNFLHLIYSKVLSSPTFSTEVGSFERFRKASNNFHAQVINNTESKKTARLIAELQNHLNEIILSVESEIRFSKERKCTNHLLSSRTLDNMVELSRKDQPTGFLGIILNFVSQLIIILNDFLTSDELIKIVGDADFLRPTVKLLECSKELYPVYDEAFINLSSSICKILRTLHERDSGIADVFIAEDFSCCLVDSLVKGIHLGDLVKGVNCRNGILDFLRVVTTKKAAKYIFKYSDLALLSSISLGAHFSQLPTALKTFSSISSSSVQFLYSMDTPSNSLFHQQKELSAFLSMVHFCQQMIEQIQLSSTDTNSECKELAQLFESYITDHIKVYFLKNILKTCISDSSEFTISALLYYCSWIIRIIYVNSFKDVFLNFFFKINTINSKTNLLWRNFSTTSFYTTSSLSTSTDSISVVGSNHTQSTTNIPAFILTQLSSQKQDSLLTAIRLFSNLFCYHSEYAIRELFIEDLPLYYSNNLRESLFYANVSEYLSLINSSCSGSQGIENFHVLQEGIMDKIKLKMQFFHQSHYESTSQEALFHHVEQIQSSTFYSISLNCFQNYWNNSYCTNLALTEFLQEILTCPIPVVYGAFLFSTFDAKTSFYNCIMNAVYNNEFVIKNLTDPKVGIYLQKLRSFPLLQRNERVRVIKELERDKKRLEFVQNYILLEEFIREIVAIMQAHALNFYGCIEFKQDCCYR